MGGYVHHGRLCAPWDASKDHGDASKDPGGYYGPREATMDPGRLPYLPREATLPTQGGYPTYPP